MKLRLPHPSPANDRTPLALEGERRVLLLSDIHVPFHDVQAIEAAVNYGLKKKPITDVYFNGDLLDFYTLSTFDKDPAERDISTELTMGAELVFEIAKAFPKARIWLKLGNHENRWGRYLRARAPDLASLPELSVESILRQYVPDVHVIEDDRLVKMGKLLVVHGHEVGRGSGGAHPAKWLHNKTGTSSLCGHFHRSDEFTTKTALGIVSSSWAVGALCQLEPNYLPRNQWNHGAAIIEIDDAGDFRVDSFRINCGRIW